MGRYRLQGLVGTGGLATVFRAVVQVDGGDEQVVAVKVLNPARVLTEEVKRFGREYKALARMNHPNIVRVHEAGVERGYPWIAMEYVDGTDLDTEIARWRATDPGDRWQRVERILRGLCQGLGYVHDLGLVHRDLKPGNVLLTRDGVPKISDFGVVKGGENTQSTNLTMAGRLVGTVAFMAPELITDEGVDKRTDLYALGAVLYLMCTYHRPIEADSIAGYLARHLTEIPRPAGALDPTVPPVLERICARLLQKDRTYRYPTAQAVVQALDRPEETGGPPLRGRDDVANRWTTFLLDLQARGKGPRRKGLVVGLIGPVGAGRTHLLRALVDTARGHGLRVAASSAHGDPLGELAGVLGVPLTRAGDVGELGSHLGPEPTVLAIDDLDRTDTLVVRAVGRLTRMASPERPLLVVFTAADAEGELVSLADGGQLPCVTIALGPVDPKAVIAMLRDRGITGSVAPMLARRLHAEYAGLPGPMMDQVEALVAEGWFAPAGDGLKPQRPLDDFRRSDLPVPPSVRDRVLAQMSDLDPADHELCELLALIERAASPGLLERCRPDGTDTPRRLDQLVKQRILLRVDPDTTEHLALRDPCAGRVLRAELRTDPRRQAFHARIAAALAARKRRANALEVARHLRAAGDEAGAYPLYVQAARRAAREGRFGEVLEVCDAAEAVRVAGERALPPDERPRLARWLRLLRGEALLARRGWEDAIPPLAEAAAAARAEGDPAGLARALGSLGRAHYRAGHYEDAEPLLREALQAVLIAGSGKPEALLLTGSGKPEALLVAGAGEPEALRIAGSGKPGALGTAPADGRAPVEAERAGREEVEARDHARRALADIALRSGRLDEAEDLFGGALAAAVAAGSRDAEARARRGLAHIQAVRGNLQQAAELLGQADDLLNPDGDYRVRAGVLARAVELDAASGRYGSALYRAESLVELARRHGMGERLPGAYALLAELWMRLGRPDHAEEAAQQSLVFARATEDAGWEPRLRVARVLADLGRHQEALGALPPAEELLASPLGSAGALQDPVSDPPAQYAAVAARLHAPTDPTRARDLAAFALNRPAPLLVLVGTRIAQDAARALVDIGQIEPARNAVKRGLKLLGSQGDGVRLELLLVMNLAAPDPRVSDAIRQLVARVLPGVPAAALESFEQRPGLREP